MSNFKAAQLSGMRPSLLANRIRIPSKNLDLLLEKICPLPSGCWEWVAATVKGYGVVKIRSIRSTSFLQAHRLCYELAFGAIPAGLHVHHKVEAPTNCIGPRCVNPAHMQLATAAQHTAELTPTSIAYIAGHRDCCAKGHVYAVGTVWISKEGYRHCLVCQNSSARAEREAARLVEGRDKFRWRDEHRKTHCLRGHPLSGDNAKWVKTKWGIYAQCHECHRMKQREYVARKNAKK